MLIVLDTSIQNFQRNRVFDKEYAARFPGALSVVRLNEEIKKLGHNMVTSDIYASMPDPLPAALCLSDRITPFVKRPLRSGKLRGVALTNFESPNVDLFFYHTLSNRSALFENVFLWRGVRERVAPGVNFHEAYFPQSQRTVIEGPVWRNRDLLVMVASNKQAAQSQGTVIDSWQPLKVLKKLLFKLIIKWILTTDPMLRMPNLYPLRVEAAYYFSHYPGFRLYGKGWDKKIFGFSGEYNSAILNCVGGAVEDKIATMSRYRFALCFENCVFSGYVTEKIFDCFYAGCIPIYYGAPDIDNFVPQETFIDFRDFHDFAELRRYLNCMTEMEAKQYFEAANDFLNTKAFDKFQQETYVNDLLITINKEAENY